MKLSLIIALSVAAGGATYAFAQQHPLPPPTGAEAPRFPQTRADAVAHARERFATADRNHDGFVTRDEAAPPPAGERRDLFAMMDTNRDGQISRSEFQAFPGPGGPHRGLGAGPGPGDRLAMRDRPGELRRQPLRPLRMMALRGFERLDANRDGKVSAAEAERAATERFDRLDADHDGMLTWAESWMGNRALAFRAPPGTPARD